MFKRKNITVTIEKTDDVWTVIHNRPETRNAMNPASADDLVLAFEAFDKSDAKFAVLWGVGRSFCASWDLKYAASLSEEERLDIRSFYFPIGLAPAPRGSLVPTRMELTNDFSDCFEQFRVGMVV